MELCQVAIFLLEIKAIYGKFSFRCPAGYRIGRLEPHHAELVASKWNAISQSPNKNSWIKRLILSYHTAAVFPDEDPAQPVAWAMQYYNAEIGLLYTMETHRRKGMGLAVVASLCQSVFKDCPADIPLYCTVKVDEKISNKLFEKIGFMLSPFSVDILNVEVE